MARARVGEAGRFSVVSMHIVCDGWALTVKRALDIAVSGALLVLLLPVMLGVAVAVVVTSPGPILFSQERYGFRKRRFRMLKFRTMAHDAERLQASLEDKNEAVGPVFKIAHDPRVTRFGRLLRRTSLDELPQLWNVLKGDMSLVGPRPLPIRDVRRFEAPWLTRRFSVRPGLTCLWQVSGRSNLSFEEWITLDLKYIDEWSLRLDFLLLLKTVPAVLSGRGAV
jgi:exopolysaccharide biosynthesis polyprenyl glycosylphosphotransferase